ncbi:hypothetical protein [Candidatus Nitrosocosmicus sp. R]
MTIYFSLTLIVLSSLALLINFSILLDFEKEFSTLRNYLYEIFLMFTSFSPFFVLVLLFAVPFRWIADFSSKLINLKDRQSMENSCQDRTNLRVSYSIPILTLILFFSILIALLPHLPFLNLENKSISVDTGNYGYTVKVLTTNKDLYHSFLESFQIQFGTHPNAASGDRPLTLFIMVVLSILVPVDFDTLVDTIVPIILSPLLVLSVYYLVREFTNNQIVSLIAAFLTTISPQILVGIYGGLLANWFALTLFYFSVYGILKYLKSSENKYLIILIILIILLRFTHVYSWIMMTPILIVFSIIYIIKDNTIDLKFRIRKAIIFSLVLFTPYLLGNILLPLLVEVNQPNNLTDLNNIFDSLTFKNLSTSLESLTYSVMLQNGGITANGVILALCIGWIAYFYKFNTLTLFISVILILSIVPVFLGNNIFQSRILYNIPFQIPAAVTLYYIFRVKSAGKIAFISIVLCLVTITLRTVSNLIFTYN